MILDDILARTRADLAIRREQVSLSVLEAACASLAPARSLAAALRRPGAVTCIAEHKRRSPSAGWIRQDSDVAEIARAYAGAGAAALSVLTDEPFFGGSLDDLRAARAAVSIPILRKDFMVDRYQVLEARAAGADAILIIVSALADPEITALLAAAREIGVEALVEVHDRAELDRALALGATIVGINNRDLRTLQVDHETAIGLLPHVPPLVTAVAESGLSRPEDLRRLRATRCDAVLMGEVFMTSADPAATLAQMAAAARA